MWLEEAEEPEDNVLALTVSFLSVTGRQEGVTMWLCGVAVGRWLGGIGWLGR